MRRGVPTEHEEAVALAGWLAEKGVRYCHVPNGGLRSPRAGARFRREGVSAGVPDYLIFSARGGAPLLSLRGVAVELKRSVGGRVSPAQEEWIAALAGLGWHAFVAYGVADAVSQLEECL